MEYEDIVLVPDERIGVLVGEKGTTKKLIESKTGLKIEIDSRRGEVKIIRGESDAGNALKAVNIVKAIARGFTPKDAFALLHEDIYLQVIDLADVTRNARDLERQRARLIGTGGKARRMLEEYTGANISTLGNTVAIIGDVETMELAADAVRKIAQGTPHGDVYREIQKRQKGLL